MALTVTADDILRDLFNTEEGRTDPYPLLRRLHSIAPFHRSSEDGMWYATRYETCRSLLVNPHLGHDEERMFRQPGMTDEQRERLRERFAERRRRGFSMLTENPPDHTRLRRLVSRAFTTPRVESLRDRVVTTTNVIGNGLLALSRHPDQMARLWADPALVGPAVEEILRFDTPVPFVVRDVLEPVEIDGVSLEAGAHVVALLGAANHDPERFEDPDRLDIGRPDNTPVTFGWGIHHCLGAPLARLELQLTFAGLRERFSSLEVLETEPARIAGFLRGVKELPVRVTPR